MPNLRKRPTNLFRSHKTPKNQQNMAIFNRGCLNSTAARDFLKTL